MTFRELIFRDYRIIYLLRTEHLYVVSVIHGSRDLAGRHNPSPGRSCDRTGSPTEPYTMPLRLIREASQ